MEDGDDPYEVLGVPRDASDVVIKKAYRKLALRHHPDKQNTEEERIEATRLFAKISNAYEILSDKKKKREYDIASGGGGGIDPFAFGNMEHEFFHRNSQRHHPFHFHDPFEIFRQAFGEDFGGPRGGGLRDPFFASPFSSMSSSRGSLFDDPFFGGSSFGSGMGGNGGVDPISMMHHSMGMMNGGLGGLNNGPSSTFVQSFTSSNSLGVGGGQSVSTSTTTRIVNGRRQTVTETVIQKPDGTIERRVHSNGGNDGSTRMLNHDPSVAANRQVDPPPRSGLLGTRHRSSGSGSNQRLEDPPQYQRNGHRPLEAAPQRKKMKKRVSGKNTGSP